MPLSVEIGGDPSGFVQAMAKAQAVATVTAGEIKRRFEDAAKDTTAAFAGRAGRSLLGPLAVGGVVVGGILAISKALNDASEQMKEFIELGDKAAAAGVSAEFFQRFTKGAQELTGALKSAGEALTERYDVNNSGFAIASEIFVDLLRNVQSPAFTQFVNAFNMGDKEASIRAVVAMVQELFDLGRKIEGLKIAEVFFGQDTADRLRTGQLQIADMARNLDDMSSKDIISNAAIQAAKELDDRITSAKARLDEALQISISFAETGERLKGIWASVLESIAAVATKMREAVNSLRQAENARVISGLESSIEREERAVKGGAPAGRLIGLRAELMRQRGETFGPGIEEAQFPRVPTPPLRPLFEPDKPARGGGGKGASESADEIDRLVKASRLHTAVKVAEAEAYGKSNVAQQVAIAQARIEVAQKEANRLATDEERQAILAGAEARGRAADQTKKLSEFQELQRFAGAQLVDVLDRATEKGAKLSDIMLDVAQSIKRAALQALILGQGPLAGLFGTAGAGTSTGGLIGFATNAFKPTARASGGPISAGRPYLVGEHGSEIIMPRSAGTVIPRVGSNVTYAPVNQITAAPGVTPEQLAAVLDRHDQQFIRRLPQIARAADKRFG